MNDSVEQILSTLVFKVAEHFGFETHDALAAVAQSKTANDISVRGNDENLTVEQICQKIFNEIALAE